MDKDKKLQELFENDPLGLLNIKPSTSSARNEDERLVVSFQEINDFYEKNKRAPEQGGGLQEHQLYSRLKSLRENPTKVEILNVHDKYGLLHYEKKQINSLDDILNDDPLGLLGDDSQGLFDLKHVTPSDIERAEADFVARRKPCKGFDKYEPKFKEVQKDLSNGKRKLVQFKEENLREGDFYIHNGILLLLELVDFEEGVQEFKSGSRVRKDGRTRVIFENGTESNMLYRSLYKSLLANGQAVSQNADVVNYTFAETFSTVNDSDEEVGFIYILKSLSDKNELKEIPNLYKIGYSKTEVEERIRNASSDPTYLMADVRIVMTYKCFNLNPQKFELLIHNFFGAACLDVDVFGKSGKRHTPREWFIAPLDVIEQAIHLIISGDVINYRYNMVSEEIEIK
jgi:hypothetical protein